MQIIKKSLEWIRGCAIFRPKMTHTKLNDNFFRKFIDIISMYLSALFIAKNFKIQSYENVPFLDPKWPFNHEREFFLKTH